MRLLIGCVLIGATTFLASPSQAQQSGVFSTLGYNVAGVPFEYSGANATLHTPIISCYIDERTPFATKHGVKGEEYENVIVIVGRGWNQYNFSDFLEWSGAVGVPPSKEDAYERNRNLFYVSCSRAKTRLALLLRNGYPMGQ